MELAHFFFFFFVQSLGRGHLSPLVLGHHSVKMRRNTISCAAFTVLSSMFRTAELKCGEMLGCSAEK